jgi:geranylgeranyl pyrophosphate synthase
MPDRVLDSFVAAVASHITHVYHQTAGELDGLETTLRWVHERLYAHPAFLRLPLLACEATNGDSANVIPVAAAWHLFHCAAHLLDNVADEAFAAEDLAGGDSTQPWPIGATIPRVVNDAVTLLFLAQVSLTTLRRSRVDPQRVVSVVAAFNTAATRMALGQACDLTWDEDASSRAEYPSADDYWCVAGAKTGEFFGLACRAGAMLGTDDQAEIDIYGSFGYRLGVLVQLGDDLQALWKPRDRGDLITAGRTLPVVYARTVAPSTTRDQLHTLLRSLWDDPGALRQLQTMLADLGALHYLMLQAGSQHHLAHEALLSSTRPSVAQHELSRLLDEAFPAVARDRWGSLRELTNN